MCHSLPCDWFLFWKPQVLRASENNYVGGAVPTEAEGDFISEGNLIAIYIKKNLPPNLKTWKKTKPNLPLEFKS